MGGVGSDVYQSDHGASGLTSLTDKETELSAAEDYGVLNGSVSSCTPARGIQLMDEFCPKMGRREQVLQLQVSLRLLFRLASRLRMAT